jgi:hypothetical protein
MDNSSIGYNTYMRILISLILFISLGLNSSAIAKLAYTFEENRKQYGEPIELDAFPSKVGFGGYVTYDVDKNWKIKAFFINDKVRSEHLIQKGDAKLSRDDVRNWALKMFDESKRGSYVTKLTQSRVEGHFFTKGLLVYEYFQANKATIGYRSVRVLFYENDKNYSQINPKAYL